MQDRQQKGRLSLAFMAGVAVTLLAAGGAAAWLTFNKLSTSTSTLTTPSNSTISQPINPSTPTISEPVQPSATKPKQVVKQPLKEEKVKVYWLNVTDNQTELVVDTVTRQKSADKGSTLEIALNNLLAGPNDQAYTTTIPQGTKLLGVKQEKGSIHINLSQEFTEGGGSDSMTGRLAQILYTATSLEPNSQVWIDVEGKPLESLGGEGIIVDQPMTRQIFQENFEVSP